MNDLAKHVYVYSDNPVTARWDGKEYFLGSEPVEVPKGVAIHWKERIKWIRYEEIPPEVIEQRIPENPLEENDRGEAFAELKRKKKGDK